MRIKFDFDNHFAETSKRPSSYSKVTQVALSKNYQLIKDRLKKKQNYVSKLDLRGLLVWSKLQG